MEHAITFTPAQAAEGILWLCAALVAISGAVAVIVRAVTVAKRPHEQQDARIESIEERVAKHDALLNNDKSRLEVIEDSNRVTQKALLALLDHSIDGNNTEQMKQAKEDLQRHLIER